MHSFIKLTPIWRGEKVGQPVPTGPIPCSLVTLIEDGFPAQMSSDPRSSTSGTLNAAFPSRSTVPCLHFMTRCIKHKIEENCDLKRPFTSPIGPNRATQMPMEPTKKDCIKLFCHGGVSLINQSLDGLLWLGEENEQTAWKTTTASFSQEVTSVNLDLGSRGLHIYHLGRWTAKDKRLTTENYGWIKNLSFVT